MKWRQLSLTTRERLLRRLSEILPQQDLKDEGLNGVLGGFHLMELDWKKDDKLSRMIFQKIIGWDKNDQLRDELKENVPTLFYNLGKAEVQWKELRAEIKRALMNGMEAYCKGEDVDPKKVSNMIYG